jgi:hypothetical protein
VDAATGNKKSQRSGGRSTYTCPASTTLANAFIPHLFNKGWDNHHISANIIVEEFKKLTEWWRSSLTAKAIPYGWETIAF